MFLYLILPPLFFFILLTSQSNTDHKALLSSKLAKQIIINKKEMKWLPWDFLLYIPASFQYITLIITFIHAMLFRVH